MRIEYVLRNDDLYLCMIAGTLSHSANVKWALKFYDLEELEKFKQQYSISSKYEVITL